MRSQGNQLVSECAEVFVSSSELKEDLRFHENSPDQRWNFISGGTVKRLSSKDFLMDDDEHKGLIQEKEFRLAYWPNPHDILVVAHPTLITLRRSFAGKKIGEDSGKNRRLE